jgi:hypothetical protein
MARRQHMAVETVENLMAVIWTRRDLIILLLLQ